MFVWKKTHDARVKHLTHLFDTRGEIISDRDVMIGRLQRENARLLDQVSPLRPDAEKHRERVRKATMNLKQNRAKAAPAVRLEAAEPPNDPYDTARDSRRDDREIHSL